MKPAWVDGRFGPEVPGSVPTLTDGDGLFETILVDDGVPRFLEAHLDRIFRSAAALSLPGVPDREELGSACRALAGNDPERGRMRVLFDRGTAAVTLGRFTGYAPEIYEKGVDVAVAATTGHPLGDRAGHKRLPYTPLLDARRAAQDRGAFEILLRDRDGVLLEGSASNLFLVAAGTILTPPVDRPLLPGVTRGAVLAAAETLGLPFEEADVRPEDLLAADEAFLTGSLMEVVPIRGVGDSRLPPGETAARLRRELFGR